MPVAGNIRLQYLTDIVRNIILLTRGVTDGMCSSIHTDFECARWNKAGMSPDWEIGYLLMC